MKKGFSNENYDIVFVRGNVFDYPILHKKLNSNITSDFVLLQ